MPLRVRSGEAQQEAPWPPRVQSAQRVRSAARWLPWFRPPSGAPRARVCALRTIPSVAGSARGFRRDQRHSPRALHTAVVPRGRTPRSIREIETRWHSFREREWAVPPSRRHTVVTSGKRGRSAALIGSEAGKRRRDVRRKVDDMTARQQKDQGGQPQRIQDPYEIPRRALDPSHRDRASRVGPR